MTPHATPTAAPEQTSGPRRPSLNAYRHGLTAQVLILTPEEHAAHAGHCAMLRAHYRPQGIIESQLVQSIADAQWRLNRAMAIEDSIFALGLAHSPDGSTGHPEIDTALSLGRTWLAEGKQIALLSLYEQRIHRKMQKDQQSLAAEQSRRRETETDPPQPAAQSTAPAAKPTHPQPVLVFSPAPAPSPETVEPSPQRRAA